MKKKQRYFPGEFGFQNNNLLANINHQSKDKKLELNSSINYGYRKSNLFNAGLFIRQVIELPPNAPSLFDMQGNINWETDEFGNPTFNNPLQGIANPNIIRLKSFQWKGGISYRILQGLKAQINLGFNQLIQNDQESVYKKNMDPLNKTTARSMTNRRVVTRDNFIVEPQLSYQVNFQKHRINSLIGSTFQKNKNTEQYLRGMGYFSESQVGNIALAEENSLLRDVITDYRYAAVFGRIGYSYNHKYYLNLTGRRDGSSRFGKKNRFGNFGAIGAAWDFYKEDFIKALPQLSYGKFRGSYGVTGSDNIGDYQYRDTYYNLNLYPNSLSRGGLVPSKMPNPYYSWEKNIKLELALDIGLWNDKILFSSNWYRERSGNQLIGLHLPNITGFTSVQGNFPAIVQNTGWEFVMQSTPFETKKFKWNSSVNFTIPKNKLVAFPNLESSSYASRYIIGKSLGLLKLYHYTGIDPDTGKYSFEDVNGDEVLNIDDQITLSDLSRRFYGGWHNQFQYKNWNLSFLFEFVKQYKMSPIAEIGTPGEFSNMPKEVLNRWQSTGHTGKYQAYTQNFDMGFYNYIMSDATIVDASFIRMKSVSLSYNVPIAFLEQVRLRQLHLYLKGQNLFTISPYKGFDPQSGTAISLPALSTVHIGLKLTI